MNEAPPLFVFKLKHNIVTNSEVLLARRELESLLNNSIGEIKNLADLFIGQGYPQVQPFLKYRVQDKITRVPYLGTPQAFLYSCPGEKKVNIRKLQRRLAYCKEIYAFLPKNDLKTILSEQETTKVENAENGQQAFLDDLTTCTTDASWAMIRLCTHSFLLELARYMPFLGSRRGSLDDNIRIMDRLQTKLLKHLHESEFIQPYGGFLRDIEDYADLYTNYKTYLTHSIHKFKGRAFQRMTRALLNITAPDDNDIVLDPFSGSGTTLLEAQILGLKSIGIDIVEFFSKIARAKTRLVTYSKQDFQEILDCLNLCKKIEPSQAPDRYLQPEDTKESERISMELSKRLNDKIKNNSAIDIKDLARVLSTIGKLPKDKQEVVEVLLSQELESAPKGRSIQKSKLVQNMQLALTNTYLEMHIARSLSLIPETLPLPTIISADATTQGISKLEEELQTLGAKGIDAIVTSPPYVNALDYLEMHKASMSLVAGVDEFSSLNEKIVGYPSNRKDQQIDVSRLPQMCQEMLEQVAKKSSTENKYTIGLCNYICDLQNNLEEMSRIMSQGGKAAYIVGKEGYWRVNTQLITVKAAEFIKEIVQQRFKVLETIEIDLLKRRPYAKSVTDETIERSIDATTLATETIIIFEKTS